MGMIGNYTMISDKVLEHIIKLEGEDLVEYINEIEEDESIELYCIDKLWDGLHFLLTGASASEPIEEDKLSEAIVGVDVFEVDEDDGFVSCIEKGDIVDIIHALEEVDITEICAKANITDFHKNEIYPNIWQEEESQSLKEELKSEFENLLDFYKKTLDKQMNIIFSVF